MAFLITYLITNLTFLIPTVISVQFLLSMGPFTGHKGQFLIDDKDDAVRGALVLEGGELRWPAPPLKLPPPPPKKEEAKTR